VPKDHMFGSKRLPCESGYYEVYNQDNVVLVDVREAPIERITPTGVKTRDAEYALDVIIFATGYDAVTGALNQIDIRGEGGLTLKDKFAEGPRTYMGIQSAGFPNLYTINAASVGNFVRAAEPLVDWVSDCISYVRHHQFTRIAPTPEAEAAWTQHVAEALRRFALGCGRDGRQHLWQIALAPAQAFHRAIAPTPSLATCRGRSRWHAESRAPEEEPTRASPQGPPRRESRCQEPPGGEAVHESGGHYPTARRQANPNVATAQGSPPEPIP
jgi:hypothetical protein